MAKLTNSPLVSIIIPVYNGANYLSEAIDSALAQTYKNIEILVINDGSNDHGATEKIAKSYGDKIRYFSKENGGVATALNLGIKKMKGEYFSWLSHDDIYYPNKVAVQVEVMNTLYDKHTILYSSCELIDETGKKTGSTSRSLEFPLHYFDSAYFALFKGLMNGCTMLIHKDIFKKVGVFDPKFPTTQDYQLWYDMFKIFPVKFVNKDLVKSRIHSQQGSIADTNHSNEADELWSRMIRDITLDDVADFAVNLNIFYQNVAKHLEVSPLRKSYELARNLADKGRDVVSVILPTYNREYCIVKAIESVRSQTYKNFELIIVDDGSTDNTEKVIKKLKNANILYIKQKNAGVSKARNAGIRAAQGSYIAFLDSDDYWHPTHLEAHIDTLSKNPDCMMSYNNYKTEGPGSDDDGHSFYPVAYPDILFISRSVITTPSVVLRSVVLDKVGVFDAEMKVCEDLDLWRRIAKEGPIKEINQVLTIVTLRDNHYSHDKYLEERYNFLKKAIRDDENLENITIARLLMELWTVYFSGGASMSALYQNIDKAFNDFEFLHVYLRDKIGRGEFGFYLNEEMPVDERKRKADERVAFLRNGVKKYRELRSTHGPVVATRKAVKKLSTIALNKGRRVWSDKR